MISNAQSIPRSSGSLVRRVFEVHVFRLGQDYMQDSASDQLAVFGDPYIDQILQLEDVSPWPHQS